MENKLQSIQGLAIVSVRVAASSVQDIMSEIAGGTHGPHQSLSDSTGPQEKSAHDDTALGDEHAQIIRSGGLLLDQLLTATNSCILRIHHTTTSVHMPWVT